MAAATTKLAALTMTPVTGSPVSSSRPPAAGPSTTVRLSSVENSPFAAARSFSPTISGVSAPDAGRYGDPAALDMTRRKRSSSNGELVPTTTAMTHMIAAFASAEAIITRVRS